MENIIKYNSRITLKYDSITNWNKVGNTFVPLKGEVCIINPADDVYTNVTCIMKIGDGSTKFEDLPYLSAVAADVHKWAKRSASEFLDWATDKKDESGNSIYSDSPKLATQELVNNLESNLSDLINDINTYRETSGDKRWKDAPNGNVIAETYATKNELKSLSDTIGNLSNVMNFRGVVTPSEGKDDPNDDATATDIFKPYEHGDVIVYGNKEYVYVISTDSEGNVTSKDFVEFGDTQAEEQRLSALESDVNNITSDISDLQGISWKTSTIVSAETGVSELAIGNTNIDYIIWDCGSSSVNI